MSTTRAQLVEEIRAGLHGWTQDQETSTALTSVIPSSGGGTFTYDNSVGELSRGLIQVDDELLQISTAAAGVATIPPFGRGRGNSTPASHAIGVEVVDKPRFPNSQIIDTLNQVILSLDSVLYGVSVYEFTPNPVISTYAIPRVEDQTGLDVGVGGLRHVLAVSQRTFGPSLDWRPIRRWRIDPQADATEFATTGPGTTITFNEVLEPGRTVKVVYATGLVPLASGSSTLSSTGLQESCRDILVMLSQARLLLSVDFSRVQNSTVEQQARNQLVPVTSATSIARQLTASAQQRVDDEKMRLLRLYPTFIRYTR